MLSQFLIGISVSAVNIAIHALVMAAVIGVLNRLQATFGSRPWLHLIVVMIGTALVLMVAHGAEVLVWSGTYRLVGATPVSGDSTYFAFVNYTTLGYGDIVPVARWRLLGPITAMNGVLLFGWSTAVLYAVLRQTLTRRFPTWRLE
jgi:hypothetical protein